MKPKTTPGWQFPSYPLFVPVHPSKSKPKWLAWGRNPAQILVFGERDYFRKRGRHAAAQDREIDHEARDRAESYPRIVNQLTKEGM
jgi:hypothetical protein